MNLASKSPLSAAYDPVAAAIISQLQQKVEEQDAELACIQQVLAADSVIQQLKDALRLHASRCMASTVRHSENCKCNYSILSPDSSLPNRIPGLRRLFNRHGLYSPTPNN
jgi:hypothetical protein